MACRSPLTPSVVEMTGASERAELIFWRLRVRRRTDQSLTASISHLGNKEAFPSTLSVCELQKYHMETNSPPVQVARPIFFGPIIVLSPFCRIGILFLWFLLLLASLQGAGAVLCWGTDVGCLPLFGETKAVNLLRTNGFVGWMEKVDDKVFFERINRLVTLFGETKL